MSTIGAAFPANFSNASTSLRKSVTPKGSKVGIYSEGASCVAVARVAAWERWRPKSFFLRLVRCFDQSQ